MNTEKERLDETKKDMLNFWIEELVKYFKEIKFEVEPLPQIELNGTPNADDDLFIKTGYYEPEANKLVLFVNNRHIKDILRTFCHEMVHRNQNLRDPEKFMQSASSLPLAQDNTLQELEGEAYLMGNLLLRRFTERYTSL